MSDFTAPPFSRTKMASSTSASRPHFIAHHANNTVNLYWQENLHGALTAWEALGNRYAKCIVTIPQGDVVQQYGSSPWVGMCVEEAKLAAETEGEVELEGETVDAPAKAAYVVAHHAHGTVHLVWYDDIQSAKKSFEDLGKQFAKVIVQSPSGAVVEKYGSSQWVSVCVEEALEVVGSGQEKGESKMKPASAVAAGAVATPVAAGAAGPAGPAAGATGTPPGTMSTLSLANDIFYIYNKHHAKSRLAMWGVGARDMGPYAKEHYDDQKWILRPSADAAGYFIVENAYRTGYCISVLGDGDKDVGVRPVSEGTNSPGHLWKFAEQSDGTYILSSKRTPNARLAAGRRFINYDGPVYEDQKWLLLKWTPGPHIVAHKVGSKVIFERFETLEGAKTAYDELGMKFAKVIVSEEEGGVKEQYGNSPHLEMTLKGALEEAAKAGPLGEKSDVSNKAKEEAKAKSETEKAKVKAADAAAAAIAAAAIAAAASEAAKRKEKEEAESKERARLEAIARKEAEDSAKKSQLEAEEAAKAAADAEANRAESAALEAARQKQKDAAARAAEAAKNAKKAAEIEAEAQKKYENDALLLEQAKTAAAAKKRDALDAEKAEKTAAKSKKKAENAFTEAKDEKEMAKVLRMANRGNRSFSSTRVLFLVERVRLVLAIILGAYLGYKEVSGVVALLAYVLFAYFGPGACFEIYFDIDDAELEPPGALRTEGVLESFGLFTVVYLIFS